MKEAPLKTTFVLVDFENVQPSDLNLLSGSAFKVKVFLGANQGKIPLEMARALQAFGSNAEYIQIDGTGRNALDFHIAYYIGRLVADNTGASFHVISKDTGFDPLIRHMASKGVSCRRSTTIADLPGVKAVVGPPRERIDMVIDNLAKRKAARPRTLKTLRSSVKTLFGKQLTDGEVDGLVDQLKSREVVKVVDDKVQYTLP